MIGFFDYDVLIVKYDEIEYVFWVFFLNNYVYLFKVSIVFLIFFDNYLVWFRRLI